MKTNFDLLGQLLTPLNKVQGIHSNLKVFTLLLLMLCFNTQWVSAQTVPAAPTNIVATKGDGQITIDFTPGSDGGSPITNYEYKLDNGSWTPFNPASTSAPLLITGLVNCNSYSVQIRAVNSVGSGAGSLSAVVTPRARLMAGIEWATQSSAADNEFYTITYGNGLFVAVSSFGDGEFVMTSPDGINWTSRVAATNNSWTSVTYGNGLFVAVASFGDGDFVMTSPDGINWTSRAAPDISWLSVTYGNGLFVAVASTGTGDRVMTSPDGITWTSRVSAADNSWNSVTYGNGLFVAVSITGIGNRVMTSPDGINWTSRASAADNLWRSVAYGNGLFVAVAGDGTNRVMTSPDGITWTSRASAANNNWQEVVYGNGLFVAVAASGTGNRVMTSPDGINWTSRASAANNNWRSVTYGNGLFVAVASSGTGNRVMTSSVGDFVPAKPEITSITPGTTDLSIAFTAPGDIGGSAINNYEYSIDNGLNWITSSPATILSPISISGLTASTEYQVQLRAVNSQGSGCPSATMTVTTNAAQVPDAPTNVVATEGVGQITIDFTPGSDGGSPITNYEYKLNDGSWTSFNPVSTSSPLFITGLDNCTSYSIEIRAVNSVGNGAGSETVFVTPRAGIIAGIDWTEQTSVADLEWNSVTYGNGKFVAVASSGTGSRVMTSTDGFIWTSRISAADNNWRSVTYGNGLFVAVASSGTGNRVMTSQDGITWTSRTSAADNSWRSITYGNGLFVAVASSGTGNRVMTSPDGINWTSRTSAADNSWRSVSYGDGLFVAVASSGTGNRVMTSQDGITWTSRASATDNDWYSVTYGNGLFVAVAIIGDGEFVMTSPDGINWTSRVAATNNSWRSVAYGNGLFVAAATTGTDNRVMTSPNGIDWTNRTSAADNEWYSVTYGDGKFVAVSITGTGNRIMTSLVGLVPAKPDITGITPGSTDLSIAFTAPGDIGGSAINNYEYSIDNGLNWITLSPATTSSPLTISGLTTSTEYEVQLRAVNSQGSGCPSETFTETTTSISSMSFDIECPNTTFNADPTDGFTFTEEQQVILNQLLNDFCGGCEDAQLRLYNTQPSDFAEFESDYIKDLTALQPSTYYLYYVWEEASEPILVTINQPTPTSWYVDGDADGYVGDAIEQCARPEGGFLLSELEGEGLKIGDCNDKDENEYPGQSWYVDGDGDGYVGDAITECERPSNGYLESELSNVELQNGDCNDEDGDEYPGQSWYVDGDGDGYVGDANEDCVRPEGGFLLSELEDEKLEIGDCDDKDATLTLTRTWYKDEDNDGYSDGTTLEQCTQPKGYELAVDLTATSGDCDDDDETLNPETIWYLDGDNDGYSDGSTKIQCEKPIGYKLVADLTAISGDCDDCNEYLNPATIWYLDADNDGFYKDPGITSCTSPGSGYKYVNVTSGDCDDNNAAINPESGDGIQIAFTGAYFSSTNNSTANVTLSATIKAGAGVDITSTKARFINRDNNQPIGNWLNIGLLSSSDKTTGTITTQYSVTLGATEDARQITIGIELGGEGSCFGRNESADNVVINVAKPMNDFVTGGGFMIVNNSAGIKAADVGSRTNFGFNAKYNKTLKKIQGNLNIIVRRTENGEVKVYQIKSNNITSLSAVSATTSMPARATLNGKANIQDITDQYNPIAVDGNATVQLTMTDFGEPGTKDVLGVTLWNKDGGLWYASNWDGMKTVEQVIHRGNIQVNQPQSAIGKTTTSITLASSIPTSNLGQTVTFTATIVEADTKANPTGYVVFYDNDALLGYAQISSNARAVISTAALKSGTHNITAYYRGDTKFAASERTIVQNVVSGPVNPLNLKITGMGNNFNYLNMDVLGNPSNDKFTIKVYCNNDQSVDMRIADLSGNIRETYTGLKNGQMIKVGQSLESGLFVVEIIQGKNRLVKKIVKLK